MKRDDESFELFVHANSPRLLRAAWLMGGSPSAAEELVQAVLERMYVRWNRIDQSAALAYARRALLNEHIDTTRRRAREHLTSQVPERASVISDNDSADSLIAALRRLTPRERQVVVMRHYADMAESDVAEALGVSLGTVKSTASRGLVHLRQTLATEGDSHVR